jgi:agmatine/peptidylarginine deiminase
VFDLQRDIADAIQVAWELYGMQRDEREWNRETLAEFVTAATTALDSFTDDREREFDKNTNDA